MSPGPFPSNVVAVYILIPPTSNGSSGPTFLPGYARRRAPPFTNSSVDASSEKNIPSFTEFSVLVLGEVLLNSPL
ncbi:unnamed protein product [Spirodela intermedia]|uniref:Uncharacterized protein n=2 Tax=Spirodela intermedia TaxID=51605 RepID=A0A7I8IUE7_SPIIN|nr:unnamed protein product [Spirodela intermedia]CAA6661240.1 unnamed protein product [Spirodela intermedia]CAA7397600.1 unnamed protein product [Spirodela intermedia]